MSDAGQIRLERDGAIASIVLDNGPYNFFGDEAFHDLVDCIGEIEGSDARAAVWRAEGEIFSGGVDVNSFQRIVDAGPRAADAFSSPLIDAVRRLEALPIPTLAICHGLCLTAGLEVALGCDMIWAGESSQFGLVEKVVGLTPGAGGTQRMAERAGPGRAREFVMTGRRYDAVTLERWNVVNRVLPDDELHEKGMKFARELAEGPTLAHRETKRIVRAFLKGGIDAADRATPEAFSGLFASQDLQNAVRQFLEEGPGKAKFEGR